MCRFLEIVSKDFEHIRSSFKRRIEYDGLAFDYDIFSDTMLKCDERADNGMTDSELIGYFWVAFKRNTLNNKERNLSRLESMSDDFDVEDSDDCSVDADKVSAMIRSKFGDEMYNLYIRHLCGSGYKELERQNKNVKYQFRRIREYIRNNFKLE